MTAARSVGNIVRFGTGRGERPKSEIESLFWFLVRAEKLPEPTPEYHFHPKRKWRFDAAYPERKLAIELEGAVWVSGRHTRGSGFIADCEKYNAAVLMGWRVLRFTREFLQNGEAIKTIREALA